MFCPQCGKPVDQGARFCGNCGFNLAAAQQTTAPAAQPAAQPAQTQPVTPVAPAAAQPQATPQFAAPQPQAQPQPQFAAQPQFVQQGAPAATVNPQVAQLQQDLSRPQVWQTAFGGVGIGLAAALVVNLVVLLLCVIFHPSGFNTSLIVDDSTQDNLNLFKGFMLMLLVAFGGSSKISYLDSSSSSYTSSTAANMTLSFQVLGLAGIALLVGCAFGVYMLARKNGVKFRWAGAVSALVAGLAVGVVSLIFAACSTVKFTDSYYDESLTISMVSARTFFMPFILAALGALAGFALASSQAASRSNVFLAYSSWKSHTRGWLRTLVEFFEIVFALLAAVVFIAMIVLFIVGKTKHHSAYDSTAFVPYILACVAAMGFGTIVMMLLSIVTFGGIEATQSLTSTGAEINFARLIKKYDPTLFHSTMRPYIWVWWVVLVLFIVALLYLVMREGLRNQYDPAKAGWDQSWQAPLASFGVMLVLWVLFPGVQMTLFITLGIRVEPSILLLVPVFVFIVEALARLIGQPLVTALPALYKLVLPGTVAVDAPAAAAPVAAQAGMAAGEAVGGEAAGTAGAAADAQPVAFATSATQTAPAAQEATAQEATEPAPAADLDAPTVAMPVQHVEQTPLASGDSDAEPAETAAAEEAPAADDGASAADAPAEGASADGAAAASDSDSDTSAQQ